MQERAIEVVEYCDFSASQLWCIAGDFCGLWHPAIATLREEKDSRGSSIRVFTIKGEKTLYKERLTYFSDSDRVLRYTHLQGIDSVQKYEAKFSILDLGNDQSKIVWGASIVAEKQRAEQIAEGTRLIFESGINALVSLAGIRKEKEGVFDNIVQVNYRAHTVAGQPSLALSVTPKRNDYLCVYLHGIGGNRHNWEQQMSVSGSIMQSVALDLRGYGESELGAEQTTIEDCCDDILRLVNEFKAKKIVLCGLSYGSWIATAFSMRYPALVAGVVLSGGCTGMSEASDSEREAFRHNRQIPLDAGQTPADFADSVVELISGPLATTNSKSQLHFSMSSIQSRTYRDALLCFTQPTQKFDFSLMTMPVLLMTGEHDVLAPPVEIRDVAYRIADQALDADVQFEIIANAGHVCNLEQPDTYSRLLISFLQKVSV